MICHVLDRPELLRGWNCKSQQRRRVFATQKPCEIARMQIILVSNWFWTLLGLDVNMTHMTVLCVEYGCCLWTGGQVKMPLCERPQQQPSKKFCWRSGISKTGIIRGRATPRICPDTDLWVCFEAARDANVSPLAVDVLETGSRALPWLGIIFRDDEGFWIMERCCVFWRHFDHWNLWSRPFSASLQAESPIPQLRMDACELQVLSETLRHRDQQVAPIMASCSKARQKPICWPMAVGCIWGLLGPPWSCEWIAGHGQIALADGPLAMAAEPLLETCCWPRPNSSTGLRFTCVSFFRPSWGKTQGWDPRKATCGSVRLHLDFYFWASREFCTIKLILIMMNHGILRPIICQFGQGIPPQKLTCLGQTTIWSLALPRWSLLLISSWSFWTWKWNQKQILKHM